MRILMAENHEVFASTVTREFLSGHDVLVVNTVQRALDALESDGPFDAILSDFDLNDGYGTELVRGLRDSEFSALVLAMSAKDDANVALIGAGADVACSKMEFSDVRELLDDLLTPVPMKRASVERMLASLDGLTVGDAFGERFFVPDELATEWIRQRKMPEPPWAYTDDSEMAIAIVELLAERGHVDQSLLARAFVRRFVADPDRGYGAGAYRLLQHVRTGTPWEEASRSLFGGQGSMGNGGAMRVAPLGAFFADDLLAVVREARLSAQVTHAHLEGQAGAVAVAAAAAFACRHREGIASGKTGRPLDFAIRLCPPGATRDGLIAARDLHTSTSVAEAAATLGSGARLLASDTVPFALWCADRHLNDFGAAMWSTAQGLGDRDTTCAIAGGVVAGNHRPPDAWLRGREPLRFESGVGSASVGGGLRDRAEAWLWSLRARKRPRT